MSGEDARLACGTCLLALVEQVSEGTPPADPAHQATCPHCRRALARIGSVMEDVRGLAEEPVAVPHDLARQVMRRLRGERSQIALSPSARGRTVVNESLVAQVARRAALAVPDVAFASAVVEESEAVVRVSVRLVVAYGPSLGRIAATVRERVVVELAELTGVRVERVDVSVEDLS